ncbi:metal-dependent hydrolase [Halomarina ordinaria]|uniref:Metal-dependent hydrolase n=1 Tax=Halomarina ordinaria TaxID=3033939 RepID=A0ABD5U8W2_9EURY|nr:metal-dependent hydrolase [Halomarina sp. PSRA2]
MWFPAHLAVGALLARRVRLDTRWCLLGAALPDLVDKPLGVLGVFPAYQTLSHSLLGLALAATLASSVGGRALAAGWLSHLAADCLQLTLNGRAVHAGGMLGWPLTGWENPMVVGDVPAYADTLFPSVPLLSEGYVAHYVGTPSFALELLLCAYALGSLVSAVRLRA